MAVFSEYERRTKQMKSHALTTSDKALALDLTKRGFPHKRIAALFDVNQGRIAEVTKPFNETN
jgi:hypothetical protein